MAHLNQLEQLDRDVNRARHDCIDALNHAIKERDFLLIDALTRQLSLIILLTGATQ